MAALVLGVTLAGSIIPDSVESRPRHVRHQMSDTRPRVRPAPNATSAFPPGTITATTPNASGNFGGPNTGGGGGAGGGG